MTEVECDLTECPNNDRKGCCTGDKIKVKIHDDGEFYGPVCRTGIPEIEQNITHVERSPQSQPQRTQQEAQSVLPPVIKPVIVWFVDGSGKGRVVCVNEAKTKVIDKFTRATTNNEAEWEAVLAALGYVGEGCSVEIRSDSLDVVKWVRGEYKTRDQRMKEYKERVLFMVKQKRLQVTFVHVPREENLAGMVMEGKMKL